MRIIGGKHRGAKLYTLDGLDTRPTLDRVKEPLFSIINFNIIDSNVLDLFAGSGALGLESISRGAKKVTLCDNSKQAIHIIEKNVEKLREQNNIILINKDYLEALKSLKNEKFDIIFLDPPYNSDFYEKAILKVLEYNLLNEDGIIILETDDKDKLINNINKIEQYEIYDQRKYGRVFLIFIKLKCV